MPKIANISNLNDLR